MQRACEPAIAPPHAAAAAAAATPRPPHLLPPHWPPQDFFDLTLAALESEGTRRHPGGLLAEANARALLIPALRPCCCCGCIGCFMSAVEKPLLCVVLRLWMLCHSSNAVALQLHAVIGMRLRSLRNATLPTCPTTFSLAARPRCRMVCDWDAMSHGTKLEVLKLLPDPVAQLVGSAGCQCGACDLSNFKHGSCVLPQQQSTRGALPTTAAACRKANTAASKACGACCSS